MKYEVRRTIRVLEDRLPRMTLKPAGSLKSKEGENALLPGDTIMIQSPDFETIRIFIKDDKKYDIEFEKTKSLHDTIIKNVVVDLTNCSIVFDYPIPIDNKTGDYISIEYSIEIKSKNAFIPQEQFKSVNDSHFQKHEIVLAFNRKKDRPSAKLSQMELFPRSVHYLPKLINTIPFDSRRKSYTVYFEFPKIDVLYYLDWKW